MKATDEQVYRYLLGDITIGSMYNSPLPGREDDTPSFGLWVDEDEVIKWKDFGAADVSGDKAVNLVMELRGVSYAEAMDIIEFEIEPGMLGNSVFSERLRRKKNHRYVPFLRYRKQFTADELKYWERFNLTKEDLLRENIFALEDLTWVGGNAEKIVSQKGNPAFVYWFSSNPASWKVYRPLGPKEEKFRQHNITGVIEGLGLLPQKTLEDTPLIITSSTKDRVVIKKHCHLWSINPTGETAYKYLIEKKDEIESRGFTPYIMYDGDEPGWGATQVLTKETGWMGYDMRGKFGEWKDPSDFIDTEKGNHDPLELCVLINNLIV